MHHSVFCVAAFARGQLSGFAWGRGGCTMKFAVPSMQRLAELVFFQLQETVLGRDSLDEVLTFYNPVERKE